MPGVEDDLREWWAEAAVVLHASVVLLSDGTDFSQASERLRKEKSTPVGIKRLASIAEHFEALNLASVASPAMTLEAAAGRALDLVARYMPLKARASAIGVSPTPPPSVVSFESSGEDSGAEHTEGVAGSVPIAFPPTRASTHTGAELEVRENPDPYPIANKPKELNKDAIRKRQRRALALRFTAKEAMESGVNATANNLIVEWSSSLELEQVSGEYGLYLVLDPLVGLPESTTNVSVSHDGHSTALAASNLIHSVNRIPISPSVSGYKITATGIDDLVAKRLENLAQGGFPMNSGTVFRMWSGGRGTRTSTAQIPLDCDVCVVIPPGLGANVPESTVTLGNSTQGWRLLPLRLSHPIPESTFQILRTLGINSGTSGVTVSWHGPLPSRYVRGRDDVAYPCFSSGQSPVLCIDRTGNPLSTTILVTSATDEAELELASGTGITMVSLDNLPTAAYMVDIIGENKDTNERVIFLVHENEPALPVAQADLIIPSTTGAIETIRFSCPVDTVEVNLVNYTAEVHAPAGWPIDLTWSGRTRRQLGRLFADSTGIVSQEQMRPMLDLVASEIMGDLLLDAGHLGAVNLRHEPLLQVDTVIQSIGAVISERHESLPYLLNDRDLLYHVLLQPIVERAGYVIDSAVHPFGAGVARFLVRTFRDAESIAATRDEVLVALPPGELQSGQSPSKQQHGVWLACLGSLGARRALLSDGYHWYIIDRYQRIHTLNRALSISSVWTEDSLLPIEQLLRWIQP